MDKVLETVVNGIEYHMLKDVMIKPLPAIKLTKEVTEQIPTGKVDKDGFETYKTKTEIKEVESNWATGIVLQIPDHLVEHNPGFKVGDTVVYNKKFASDFDLFKDSILVKSYDILAVKY